MLEDEDLVAVLDGREPMRHDDGGSVGLRSAFGASAITTYPIQLSTQPHTKATRGVCKHTRMRGISKWEASVETHQVKVVNVMNLAHDARRRQKA
jgi:hypothetical protein